MNEKNLQEKSMENSTDKDKLLPCPHCGSEATLTIVKYNEPYMWYQCGSCNATGGSDLGESGASENWNHRSYPPEVTAVIEAAKNYYAAFLSLSKEVQEIHRGLEFADLIAAIRALEEMESRE